jgi:hypothetical protein
MEKLTPREKALELFTWFYLSDERVNDSEFSMTRKSARMMVKKLINEIIKEPCIELAIYRAEYWNSVSLELEKIEI